MKTSNHNRTIILYVFIVIFPTIFGSFFSIQDRNHQQLNKRMEEAKWIASIHESYLDNFMSETATSLEMVSMTAKTVIHELHEIQPLLEKAHETDQRYSGVYLLDQSGMIVAGSNSHLQVNMLQQVDFVEEALHTKSKVISNKPFTLENGQHVIGISSPVLDENSEILAITVALLRLDYIENILKILTPDSKIVVLSGNNEPMMGFNVRQDVELETGDWVTMPIDRLPWNIKVKAEEPEGKNVFLENLFTTASFLVLTHILFLYILLRLLQRQAEREKKENEAQKLELVGTLAATTAHEIRNPLTGIKGLVQLLGEKHNQPNDQFYFSVINEEIERINDIVSEFLILGKPTVTKLETEDVTEVIREIKPLISSEARLKNIDFRCDISNKPIFVNCTKSEMKQVILNITRNSFEAMDIGGKLSILLKENKRHCELIIIDNGSGIEEEIIEKIFAPFYTSKKTGTGLGLVVCQRIIQSFGGQIHITSKENKGTTVTIMLPLASTS